MFSCVLAVCWWEWEKTASEVWEGSAVCTMPHLLWWNGHPLFQQTGQRRGQCHMIYISSHNSMYDQHLTYCDWANIAYYCDCWIIVLCVLDTKQTISIFVWQEEWWNLLLFLLLLCSPTRALGLLNWWRGQNSSLGVCWARCPAWCSVMGLILIWGVFFQ